MYARPLLALTLISLLAGCGNQRNTAAAQACNAEIAKRLADKSYSLDVGDLSRHVQVEPTGTLFLTSNIIFDPGLSSEYRQSYECRVRIEKSGPPSVLFLQFNWNTANLPHQ